MKLVKKDIFFAYIYGRFCKIDNRVGIISVCRISCGCNNDRSEPAGGGACINHRKSTIGVVVAFPLHCSIIITGVIRPHAEIERSFMLIQNALIILMPLEYRGLRG